MLHGPDLRALHVQGDRLDGFPLQSAHLTRHVPIEALTRLLAGEAIGKLGMKSFEFLSKNDDILLADPQFRDGKAAIANPIFRYHDLPPVIVFAKQVTVPGTFVNSLIY